MTRLNQKIRNVAAHNFLFENIQYKLNKFKVYEIMNYNCRIGSNMYLRRRLHQVHIIWLQEPFEYKIYLFSKGF